MNVAVKSLDAGRSFRRALNRLDNAVWWVRYRVQPRLSRHKLKLDIAPGYYDPDTVLLHAMMAALGLYIEESGGLEKLEAFSRDLIDNPDKHQPEMTEAQAARQLEAADIWRWWTIERPATEKRHETELMYLFGDGGPMGSFLTKPTDNPRLNEMVFAEPAPDVEERYREFRVAEAAAEKREQEMLEALLRIRGTLWT